MEGNSMSRMAATLTCDESTYKKLMKIAGSRTEEARMVLRAKLILACLKGSKLKVIAKDYGVKDSTVIKWRERFRISGMNGLYDKPRSGKPKTYDKSFEESVLKILEQVPSDGMSKWDGPTVTRRLNVSEYAVWRLLRKLGICLARIFTRKVLKGESGKDTLDLSDKINRYIASYKEIVHPFILRKREVFSSQLKYNIRNLCN